MTPQEEKAEAWKAMVEDMLDLALFIIAALSMFTDIVAQMSKSDMWMTAGGGAGLRLVVRRIAHRVIYLRIVGKAPSHLPPAS